VFRQNSIDFAPEFKKMLTSLALGLGMLQMTSAQGLSTIGHNLSLSFHIVT